MDEADVGAAALAERHPECVEDEAGAHVGGELPAHDQPRKGVEDEGEEYDALPAAQVGQGGDPQLVRPLGAEVALDEIRSAGGLGVRGGRPPRLAAALCALDALPAHQPLHAAAPDELAGPEQRPPGTPVSVGVIVGGVELVDAGKQALVVDLTLGALSALAGVVADADTPKVRQMSSTPKSERRSSMNALTSVGEGRAPWRKTPRRP